MSSEATQQGAVRRRPTSRFEGGIIFTSDPADLRSIHSEQVTAVVLRRRLPRALRALSSGLPEPGFCRMVPLGAGFRASSLVGAAFPGPAAHALVHEIARMHSVLRAIDARAGHAQLAVTASDECRKFHIDYYRLRLLVTYVGPGTELAPEPAIDRVALAGGGDDYEAANRAIVTSAASVIATRAGEIVLLKGDRWDDGLAAVHRSPPIAREGNVRLLLKLTVD